jgi:cell wall-associated NlpC family hydrolase
VRALAAAALLTLAVAGCAQQAASTNPTSPSTTTKPASDVTPRPPSSEPQTSNAAEPQGHPQVVEPEVGAQAQAQAQASAGSSQQPSGVSVGSSSGSLASPVSNAQIREQLAQSGIAANPDQATLTPNGLAIAPINAPPIVQEIIAAGNQIAHLPYIYGGGHTTYVDTGYDCSGSISYVFDAAHLLTGSVVSGQLENWGDPGPGKWITVFANADHTFMIVAGLRFDTVALAETGSRWSDRPPDENVSTFAIRHPAGL